MYDIRLHRHGLAADLMPVENGPSSNPIGIDAVKPLAKVEFKNGAWLEFIDVGDGYVGIAERSPVSSPFITTTLVSEWNATPLEIYRAFAPNGPDVPALETDHNLRMAHAGGDIAEPRVLPAETFAFDDSELEEYPGCVVAHAVPGWTGDWENAFAGVTDYAAADFKQDFDGPYLFYPGAHVYHGTGTNRKTYLGACNGGSGDLLVMEVHRWAVSKVILNPYPNPATVVWDWVKIDGETFGGGQKYTFYSGHPTGRYRGRVQAEEGGSAVERMGIGAAWTKSFPVVGLSSD